MMTKAAFEKALKNFASTLTERVSMPDGQWSVKGFIDTFKNIYTISADTKIVSKILEIQLFPEILAFANKQGFKVVLAKHQNYYPDMSFILKRNESIRFAVDIKTTYRIPNKHWLCNGFTLGSYGSYFRNRNSKKNIQFPYGSYSGHFCLGIIYDRVDNTTNEEMQIYQIEKLDSIISAISNMQFFAIEKWKIASDKTGSGNTANIGSIQRIEDIFSENGMFAKLGEEWFDDYWMNFGSLFIRDRGGKTKKINSLIDFVKYRGGDTSLIVPRSNQP